MHFYLFDSFLADPKYKKILEEIENRTLSLDISGRTLRLTVLRDFKKSLSSGIENKCTTVIVIGDDKTLYKAINALAGKEIPLGIIPVGENVEICKTLGIPYGVEAVDVIANRLIEKIDLGFANKRYFISSLYGELHNFSITGDDQYEIELSKEQKFQTCNLKHFEDQISNPQDNLFETIIYNEKKSFFGKTKITSDSVFRNQKLTIKSREKSAPIIIDNNETLKTPVTATVVPKCLNMIVGRNRKF